MSYELERCHCGALAIQPTKNCVILSRKYVVYCRRARSCETYIYGATRAETAENWNKEMKKRQVNKC